MLKEMMLFIFSIVQALFFGYAMEDNSNNLTAQAARVLVSSPKNLAKVPATLPPEIKTQLIEALAITRGCPMKLPSLPSSSMDKGICIVEGDHKEHGIIAIDCDGKVVVCTDTSFSNCEDWPTDTNPSAFVWSPNHQYMIIGERNGCIVLLDHEKKEIVRRIKAHHAPGHLNQLESLAIKDHLLLSAGADGLVRLWDARSYEVKRDFVCDDPVKSAYITHLNQLLTATRKGKIFLNDIETGNSIRTDQIYPNTLSRMKLLHDPHLALIAHCNQLCGYDERQAGLAFSIKAHNAPITTLDVQNQEYFASGSFDRTVKVWDMRILQNAAQLTAHTEWIQSLSHGPDFLISGSRDATIRIWDTQPLKKLSAQAIPESLYWTHLNE